MNPSTHSRGVFSKSVPTAGDYQIYARWTPHSNRAVKQPPIKFVHIEPVEMRARKLKGFDKLSPNGGYLFHALDLQFDYSGGDTPTPWRKASSSSSSTIFRLLLGICVGIRKKLVTVRTITPAMANKNMLTGGAGSILK